VVTGGEDEPGRRTGPGVKDAAPGGMLAAGTAVESADRVRRPGDLLFAVLSLAVVAVVLGFIRPHPFTGRRPWPDGTSPAPVRADRDRRRRQFCSHTRRRQFP